MALLCLLDFSVWEKIRVFLFFIKNSVKKLAVFLWITDMNLVVSGFNLFRNITSIKDKIAKTREHF